MDTFTIDGVLSPRIPLIQGGMGVGVSLSTLAGAVAAYGGIGVISTAQIGYREEDYRQHPFEANIRAIGQEIKKARALAGGGILGCNIMVATRRYEEYVLEACRQGIDLIISGAGLPVGLPKLVEGFKTKIAPIVSSVKSAAVICKLWDRKYNKAPDLVVIEGPKAGGHLGFAKEQIEQITDAEYEEEIKGIIGVVKAVAARYQKKIPVVVAGGIYDAADVNRVMELGADGVQVASRFVTTEECDAPDSYKQSYLAAKEEDIVIIKSPVGMPGRAINNHFVQHPPKGRKGRCVQCVSTCDSVSMPYCISEALIEAVSGNAEDGLVFCGKETARSTEITTVKQVIDELFPKMCLQNQK